MEDLRLGWLSPTGEFIPCGAYEHYSIAEDIVNSSGLDSEVGTFDTDRPKSRPKDAEDVLFNHGWVLIGVSELDHNFRIHYNLYLTLSPEQRVFLEPYFETDRINRWDRQLWEDQDLV